MSIYLDTGAVETVTTVLTATPFSHAKLVSDLRQRVRICQPSSVDSTSKPICVMCSPTLANIPSIVLTNYYPGTLQLSSLATPAPPRCQDGSSRTLTNKRSFESNIVKQLREHPRVCYYLNRIEIEVGVVRKFVMEQDAVELERDTREKMHLRREISFILQRIPFAYPVRARTALSRLPKVQVLRFSCAMAANGNVFREQKQHRILTGRLQGPLAIAAWLGG